MLFITLITFIAIIICTITDIKDQKIYNNITGPLILIGMLNSLALSGIRGLFHSIISLLLALVIMFIINLFVQGLGFGDIKLFLGIACCLGLKFFIYNYIIASVLFIVKEMMFNFKENKERIKNTISHFKLLFMSQGQMNNKIIAQNQKIFAQYILIGYLITVAIFSFF